MQDWDALTDLTHGTPIVVERVRVASSGIAIEGDFELPPLANLSTSDQVFVAAFVKSHGSIKEMERTFGISYPTVKNRLNRIAQAIELLDIETGPPDADVLGMLRRGEIDIDEAVNQLVARR